MSEKTLSTIECEVLLSIRIFCFICVYHLYQLTETIQLLAEDILERRQETTRLHRCLCKLAGKVISVFFRLYELQSTLCKEDILGPALSVCIKMMLHETIRNDDLELNTALQHCCDIVSNGYNIVPTLQRCVALKIVVANRPV